MNTTTEFLDKTHEPLLQSWVESANNPRSDFPIQNLPFGRFRTSSNDPWRIGIAIGDHVLDLLSAGVCKDIDINTLMSIPKHERKNLRQALSLGLAVGSDHKEIWSKHLYLQNEVILGLPCVIRDYTDFYIGIHHATAVGKIFRPDNPLLPNYQWIPIGYHGRASSIQVSGHMFKRPWGQTKSLENDQPILTPTQKLDFELELGVIISHNNDIGESIIIDNAEDHIFGLTLFNDWSARDFQAWEYQPLGPFLSKNFASTISPWMVTLEALEPYRSPFIRQKDHPEPLSYLQSKSNQIRGSIEINIEVSLQTQKMKSLGDSPEIISKSNFSDAAYWTLAQLVTHHTIGGCNLSTGDLLGTGTLSGSSTQSAGSLLELSENGKKPIKLKNGEERSFLEDGDEIIFEGFCEKEGFRKIGFGKCRSTVLPSNSRS